MKPTELNLVNIRQGETDKIPFNNKRVTFILITNAEVRTDKTWGGKLDILDNIKSGDLLLAAWTGEYSTDIFQLDVKWLKQTELYKYHKKKIREEAKKQGK
jgi:hypothetical protein